MFVVTFSLRGRTPAHTLQERWPGVSHHVSLLTEGEGRCSFQGVSPGISEASATCAAICREVEVDGETVRTACRPLAGAACILRQGEVGALVARLAPLAILESAVPHRGQTRLTFLVRAADAADARSFLTHAAAEVGLSGTVEARVFGIPQSLTASLPRGESDTLETAIRLGYYETPRRCTMDDIGRELGITKSAVYHRLSAIENNALHALAEGSRRVRSKDPIGHVE